MPNVPASSGLVVNSGMSPMPAIFPEPPHQPKRRAPASESPMIERGSDEGTIGMHSRVSATLAAAVAAVAVIAAATGCNAGTTSTTSTTGGSGAAGTEGQSASSAARASGTPGSPGSPASAAQCATAALTVAVDNSQADAAAGSTYFPVDFTNTSGTACAMTGYPGVSFVTAANVSGHQIGAAAARDPQYGATVVRLAPHGHAHAWLQVGSAGNYPAPSCHPVTAHGLRIYPPNQTKPGYVPQDFPACALASAGLLTILPLRPGRAAQGSTP